MSALSKKPQFKVHKIPTLRKLSASFSHFLSTNQIEGRAISSRLFYGFFVGIGLTLSILLYGASYKVAQMPEPVFLIPDFQADRAATMTGLVIGYPIETMIPGISEQNKITSSFLFAIAKKESNWGKRVPRADDGSDCYNYWGYTGAGSRGVAQGHACFGSREEAISIVGARINYFVHEYEIDTPEELIVWKCGWNCSGHSSESVRKWVSDVAYYYNKVQN